jgi:cytochrome c biogenesis protein CcmG, thiol:disulfide interchange protein DsbE
MHRFKTGFLFILLFTFTFFVFEKANAQDQKNKATIVYFKSGKGPLWNKQKLDSFLLARTSKRSRLIPTISGIEQKGDTLIYRLNLKLDPNPIDIRGHYLAGQSLPDFNFKDINGNEIKMKDLKGRPMVINFWFAGCIPCIAEIPELNALKEKYKNSGVIFLSMTFEKKSKVISFLKQHPFDFIPVADIKAYCDNMTDLYPLTLFVNKNGIISSAEHLMPPLFNYDISKRIDQLDPSEFEKTINTIK